MPRYVIQLSYDGTRYNGWQRQPNVPTVQGAVEEAAARVIQEDVQLYGSGRTDAGVHAEEQFAHFDTHIPVETDKLLYSLRRMLPDDIYIAGIREVAEHFHARFDAGWRQYRYQLLLQPDPFQRMYAWYPGEGLDWKTMRRCAGLLDGELDFSGFSRNTEDLPHSRCTILQSDMEMSGEGMVCYRIRSNRFLRSMVRALVGGMVSVASGKKEFSWFKKHLNQGMEIDNIALAPAGGLFLEKVFYPKSVLDLTQR
ncbi:tRNA pseudouridine(38-40) synthase TruA [Balneolales bacterium ANBcel1]|nr:tRNA pseudouridine(38-40) synthase TruA [Balneolales bacterium ANBcel1]